MFKHAGICQIYITYSIDSNRRIYYRNYAGSWSGWTAVYDTNFKPTAADIWELPPSSTRILRPRAIKTSLPVGMARWVLMVFWC